MKRILVVEDDAIISRVYQYLFPRAGLQLELAADGEQALRMLDACQPDLVVVDLMLPKVHGVEVIKQIRARPQFESVPVIVFTNAYLSTMVKAAWRAGANECLTKTDYSPEQLIQVICTLLEKGGTASLKPSPDLESEEPAPAPVEPGASAEAAAPERQTIEPPAPPPTVLARPARHSGAARLESQPRVPSRDMPAGATQPTAPAARPVVAQPSAPAFVSPAPTAAPPARGPGPQARALPRPEVIRVETPVSPSPSLPAVAPPPAPVAVSVLAPDVAAVPSRAPAAGGMESAPGSPLAAQITRKMLSTLPSLMVSLRTGMASKDPRQAAAQVMPVLLECYELLHPLAGQASLVGMVQVGRLTGALEALLKELFEDPESLTASALRTAGHGVESVVQLLRSLSEIQYRPMPGALVLAVDDEVISRRAIQAALELADLKAVAADEPAFALRLLADNAFDLVFLDVEMPGMNGFELCSRLRATPRHQTTPVVFVTSLSDFDSRMRSTLSGGNDFIAKPFLPAELAVKALSLLLRGPARGARDQRRPF